MKLTESWYLLDDVYQFARKRTHSSMWKTRIYSSYSSYCRAVADPHYGPGRPRRMTLIIETGLKLLLDEIGTLERPQPYAVPYRLSDLARPFQIRPGFWSTTALKQRYPTIVLATTDYELVPTKRMITLLIENDMYDLLEPDFLPLE